LQSARQIVDHVDPALRRRAAGVGHREHEHVAGLTGREALGWIFEIVRSGPRVIVVMSSASLLGARTSPPATNALLVSDAGALMATSTVTVTGS
jgi:hypothetical protein